jgi:hypothetical protein
VALLCLVRLLQPSARLVLLTSRQTTATANGYFEIYLDLSTGWTLSAANRQTSAKGNRTIATNADHFATVGNQDIQLGAP